MALYLIGDVQGCDDPLRAPAGQHRLLPEPRHAGAAGRPGQSRARFGSRCCGACSGCGARRTACWATTTCTCWAWPTARARPAARTRSTPSSTRPTATRCSTGCATSRWRCTRRVGGRDLLMVHAGVLPQWSVGRDAGAARPSSNRCCAARHCGDFRAGHVRQRAGAMERRAHRRTPGCASSSTRLTRLRFCTADGVMEFESKDGADGAARGLHAVVRRARPRDGRRDHRLRPLVDPGLDRRGPDLMSTDTGCVWGGCLSAVRIGDTLDAIAHVEVRCDQPAQKPGLTVSLRRGRSRCRRCPARPAAA